MNRHGMLKPVRLPLVGHGIHRSGWPYAMSALEPLFSQCGRVVFDDFAERTFLYDHKWHGGVVHSEPWVAVLHHPPDLPEWYMPRFRLDLFSLARNSRWQLSFPKLKLVICLADNLADWVRCNWSVPCVTVYHPTEVPSVTWTPDRFIANPVKRVIQVGSFLRNIRAIHQIDSTPSLLKTRLTQDLPWVAGVDATCKLYYEGKGRRENRGVVDMLAPVSDESYDLLLAQNVVFLELVGAAANNTVIECIARDTPLVLNRLPGPESYLGTTYPLFYDHLDEVPRLLTFERLLEAHYYLKTMNKSWMSGALFRDAIRQACLEHVKELKVDDQQTP